MNKIVLALILLTVNSFISRAQTAAPDMTVFGFTIGKNLPTLECPCKAVTKTTGQGLIHTKHFKGYQYVTVNGTPVSNTCFERRNIEEYNVKKNEELPPLPALKNGSINVRFAPADAPSKYMCPFGSFDALIENSKLIYVSFIIESDDADAVFETLKKKYGTNVVKKNYQAQNGIGGTRDFYTATWLFSNLTVIFSTDASQTYQDPQGFVTIGVPDKSAGTDNKRQL